MRQALGAVVGEVGALGGTELYLTGGPQGRPPRRLRLGPGADPPVWVGAVLFGERARPRSSRFAYGGAQFVPALYRWSPKNPMTSCPLLLVSSR